MRSYCLLRLHCRHHRGHHHKWQIANSYYVWNQAWHLNVKVSNNNRNCWSDESLYELTTIYRTMNIFNRPCLQWEMMFPHSPCKYYHHDIHAQLRHCNETWEALCHVESSWPIDVSLIIALSREMFQFQGCLNYFHHVRIACHYRQWRSIKGTDATHHWRTVNRIAGNGDFKDGINTENALTAPLIVIKKLKRPEDKSAIHWCSCEFQSRN